MTEHKPLPVAGYQTQGSDSVDCVNTNKFYEERVLRRLDELRDLPNIDQRWLAIGRTQIEKAFMAINRAIFQPKRCSLPEDEVKE